jgi:type II secretory pathway pseudopilin PulG
MVIVIIGILAGLVLVGVRMGFSGMRVGQVISEIDQIQTAAETYRNDRGAYPATLGVFVGETTNDRQARVMRHVAKAWPRYTGNYVQFREQVAIATKPIVASYPTTVSLLYTDTTEYTTTANKNAAQGGLDINNLDPAETLVFWLGGIPDPTAEVRVVGFRRDPASPFYDQNNLGVSPSDVSQQRAPATFRFDPRRLVDYDQDGWFEYLPVGGTEAKNTPPYVYFDNTVYKAAPAYPYPATALGASPLPGQGPVGADAQWGNCLPYAADPPNTLPVKFVNSTKFQVISAGADNRYDKQLGPSDYISNGNPWYFTPEYYPSGAAFQEEDKDNLTNFAPGVLGDGAPQP